MVAENRFISYSFSFGISNIVYSGVINYITFFIFTTIRLYVYLVFRADYFNSFG